MAYRPSSFLVPAELTVDVPSLTTSAFGFGLGSFLFGREGESDQLIYLRLRERAACDCTDLVMLR